MSRKSSCFIPLDSFLTAFKLKFFPFALCQHLPTYHRSISSNDHPAYTPPPPTPPPVCLHYWSGAQWPGEIKKDINRELILCRGGGVEAVDTYQFQRRPHTHTCAGSLVLQAHYHATISCWCSLLATSLSAPFHIHIRERGRRGGGEEEGAESLDLFCSLAVFPVIQAERGGNKEIMGEEVSEHTWTQACKHTHTLTLWKCCLQTPSEIKVSVEDLHLHWNI